MATVILGAGIIGTSTAYYLSQSSAPSSVHLVEVSLVLFASASGFAGGFLAKDWFSDASAALGALSFAEHNRLAEEHGGRQKWGYSRSTGTSYTPGTRKKGSKRGDDWLRAGTSRADAAAARTVELTAGRELEPSWLSRVAGDEIEIISEEGSTAQVDPKRLCEFLLSQCVERGVHVHHPAKAISVSKDKHGELASIRIASSNSSTEVDIPCTRIVIASGAWSPQVFRTLFPSSTSRLPVTSLGGHSLVIKSPRWAQEHEDLGCHAVFTTDESGHAPEIFSRIGGEIYVAGANSAALPLPDLATESKIDEEVISQLQTISKRLLGLPGGADDLQVLKKGLCFRPVTTKGTPIVARIPDAMLGDIVTRSGADGGVYLAAGHGPWGISMSLGTGKVLTEMMLNLPLSADVGSLNL